MNKETLFTAMRKRDKKTLSDLLENGVAVDDRETSTGMTPLLVAAGLPDTQIVKTLIEYGADPFIVDTKSGASTLHRAVQVGNLETVKLLIQEGLFVDTVAPTTGHTPLFEAIWYKWPDIVEFLLQSGASIDVKTHYGFTLEDHIKFGASVNHIHKDRFIKIQELIDKHTRLNNDVQKASRIIIAALTGDFVTVQSEIDAGTFVDTRYPITGSFNDAHTALLVASREGHSKIVELLLRNHADANAIEPIFCAVPLHKATYNGHADIVQLLVNAPNIDINFQGWTNGYTPLHDALWHGYEDCARILLNTGARLDITGYDGKTSYDIAAESFGTDHPLTQEIHIKTVNEKSYF